MPIFVGQIQVLVSGFVYMYCIFRSYLATTEKLAAVDKKDGRKSRTFRELIFGTRSRGGRGKNATEGSHRDLRSPRPGVTMT